MPILSSRGGPFIAYFLSMKCLIAARFTGLIALLAVLPAVTFAHPGHDGGHDLTWDFGHDLGHVHYGQALVFGLLVIGAAVGLAKLAARYFRR